MQLIFRILSDLTWLNLKKWALITLKSQQGGSSGSPDIYYPRPTVEETLLQQEQLKSLQKASRLQEATIPIEAATAGYTYDPTTETFTKMSPEAYYAQLTPQEQQSYDVETLARSRQKAALEGTLPIPADVQAAMDRYRKQQTQQLASQLGPGWATSSPGLEAEQKAEESRAAVEAGVRSGEISQAQAVSLGEQASMDQAMQNYIATMTSPTIGLQNIAASYATPISQYAQERATRGGLSAQHAGLQTQRDIARMQGVTQGATSGMNMCCWTFLAGDMLIDAVRHLRDKLFGEESFVAKGYKAMSQWLVPVMNRNKAVMGFVKAVMLRPIANFCERYERDPYDRGVIVLVPVCYFWTWSWNFYGRWKLICK